MTLGSIFGSFKSRLTSVAALVIIVFTLSACDSPEEKAQAHFTAGMTFVEQGNFVKAGIEFRNALQLKENFADGWYGLALVEESEGNWRKYAGDILKAIEIDPKHLKAQVRYGKIMLLSGKLENALETSGLVMELAPDNPDALALKSAVMFRLGDKTGAIAAAEKALEIDPSNIDAILILSAEKLSTGDATAAVKILDEGLVHNKGNAQLQVVKIRALENLGRTEDIIEVFSQLIADNPDNAAFRKSLVRFYLKNDRQEKAEEEIRKIAMEHPEDVTANLDVVRFVKSTKGDDAAAHELEQLIEKYPNVVDYRFALAALAEAGKDDERAMVILGSIIDRASTVEDEIAARNKLAQLHFSRGDYKEAESLAGDVLNIDPSSTDALVLVGAMQIDRGEIDAAIANLRSSMRQQPRSVRASLLLAKAHEINGSMELAEDRFAAAYRFSNQAPRVGTVYAQFFIRHGEMQRAERLLEKIAENNPNETGVLKMLAEVKLRKQDWVAAEEIAERLQALDGADSAGYQISGAALAGLQNLEESRSAFEKAYEVTPEAGQAMKSLVQAYLRDGDVEKAENFLSNVLANSQRNYLASRFLAEIKFSKNQPEEAVKLIRDAIAGDPQEESGYVILAKYFLSVGKKKDASEVLSEGLRAIPDGFMLNMMQAGIYEVDGDISAAIAVYEKLLESRPNSEIVVNNLASLIAENAENEVELQGAYTLAKRFRNSKVPYFQDTLGWIHYRLKEYDMATPLLRSAVEKEPNMAILRYHLGMAYKAEGNRGKAIKELEQALALGKSQHFPENVDAEKALVELRAMPKTN
ncbi:tetratricopeptide repeat protein [Sneathiella sp. CAU 1612]|uniref:Tetratricopeptide repeat protein n=1 Tax=Sneathiella sedimenti TaxID=2816034 RepID=A0ABS3F2B7_9PROT|nr:tetratricopeptide repeat protein [Sneathiella sedimenti]MBO0332661.1 tetratricopeptide repeat protein [Sneathiella sedimenti]